MPRKPRFTLSGVPQHVIQRGNNREPCFYAEEDYWRYLHDLKEAATYNQAAIHAYVLMTNHVHILVTPGQPYSIIHMMQDLGRKYVRYINHTYQRTGRINALAPYGRDATRPA
jgi:putative transposase